MTHRPLTNWNDDRESRLTRGQRAADILRNGLGSWGFVFGFVAAMAVWATINIVAPFAWDPYPFILLNLFLSMLAGLQGAILLIAAKRQDAIAAALADHDYRTNLAAKAEIEELIQINRQQLELLTALTPGGAAPDAATTPATTATPTAAPATTPDGSGTSA